MRRKIHGVLWIVESMNVQIDLDPILLVGRTHARARPPAVAVRRRVLKI